MTSRGGEGLRLLVDLVLREDGVGASRRWRRYTAAEIAAGVHAQVAGDLDALTGVIAALLDGASDEIPDQLLKPLAAFFRSPVTDLTDDELQVVETSILERLVVELGAGGVLFCRDHLSRETANRLLRAVLDAVRCDARTTGGEQPP